MKTPAEGSKEAQVRALRESRMNRRAQKAVRRMPAEEVQKLRVLEKKILATADAPAPGKQQESTMKTKKTAKKAKKVTRKQAIKATVKRLTAEAVAGNAKLAKAAAKKARAPKAEQKGVPALDVAKFMTRAGGATMPDLVKQFGIEAHPMRAKIFYIRKQMPGWKVDYADKRYTATFTEPK